MVQTSPTSKAKVKSLEPKTKYLYHISANPFNLYIFYFKYILNSVRNFQRLINDIITMIQSKVYKLDFEAQVPS
jgi:hypothetical protein